MKVSHPFSHVVALLMVGAVVASCARGQVQPTPQTSATSTSAAPSTSAAAAQTPAPSPTPVSDADQVRAAVLSFQDAYNTQKWDAYLAGMCTAWRQQMEPLIDKVKKTRNDQGLTTVTVTGVNITGDSATATLDAQNELLGRKTIEMKLVREDGWKVCMTYTG